MFGTRRVPVLALAALVALACGAGGPVSPSDSPTSPSLVVLTPGPYTLTIAAGGPPSGGPSGWLCMHTGGGATAAASFTVTVVQEADGLHGATPDGRLTFNFTVAGRELSGLIRGTAGGGSGVTVQVGGDAGGQARLAGRLTSSTTVDGDVLGRVDFSEAGGTTGCSENRFTLAPR